MLFRLDTLEKIARGDVTLAIRRWVRPTVKAGGTLTTALGVIAIDAVEPIDAAELTEADVVAAGASSLEALLGDQSDSGQLYRIRFHAAGADPRLALRETPPDAEELAQVLAKLAKFDTGKTGPWAAPILNLIATRPATVSTVLADQLGMERLAFKSRVRQLKALGLTESLEIGYRLSLRGEVVLKALG